MDMIPAVFLIFGVAFAWIGLTGFVILRLRRRRRGSSLLASATPPDELNSSRTHKLLRGVRSATGRTRTRRRLSIRKVRG
jgi:hypothetical protein